MLVIIIFLLNTRSKELREQNDKIISTVEQLEEKIDSLSQTVTEYDDLLLQEITENRKSTDRQFSETKKMKSGYDLLLDEQKKQRIDSVKKDTAVTNMTAEAEAFYKAKDYREAYKRFLDVLQYQPENNEIRFKKAHSLFCINPMDSTKYNEIISDCEVLRKNGYANPKLDEIEKHIKAERGEP
ncbi:hypothetical protein [Treponema sp.]|uniref:hypothetical protein n=1 Tax=Treponema sp. TaxID=166 RepID=UPI00388D2A89